MAVDTARTTIRNEIEAESLGEFEKQVKVVDQLFATLERTTNPDAAYTMAIAWASSVLSLARIESALLAAILPQLESDLAETSVKLTALNQRSRDAEDMVYSLRGPDIKVGPLSAEVDERRAREIKQAKASRNRIFSEVLAETEKLRPERDPLLLAIGGIKRTLRALHAFTEHRFPVPNRKGRSPMSPASPDPRADPLAAFAERYVDRMENRGSAKQKTIRAGQERTRIADLRPHRDWDAINKAHRAKLTIAQ